MSDYRAPKQYKKADGFKLYRKQSGLEFPDRFRSGFERDFEGYVLYPKRTTILDVVRRRETITPLVTSKKLGMIPLQQVISEVMRASLPHATRAVDLRSARLQFVPHKDKTHRIHLFLDDQEGFIDEEREAYLTALERAAAVSVNNGVIVPSLEIGKVRAETEPSLDVLKMLTKFIPEYVSLQPVTPHPNPKYMRY